MTSKFKTELLELFSNLGVSKEHREKTFEILKDPYFKQAETIEEFKTQVDYYSELFSYLKDYAKRPYGRGELIPYVSIKGVRMGGVREKDINVGGLIMEVKELDKDKFFNTATDGRISGTKFTERLEVLMKYLPHVDPKSSTIREVCEYYDEQFKKGGLSAGFLRGLYDILKTLDCNKNQRLLKVLGTNYLIEEGSEARILVLGNTVDTNLPFATQKQIARVKVSEHPWTKSKGEGIWEDLNIIRESYFSGLDYLFILRKNGVECLSREEALERFTVSRITMGSIILGLT